MKLHSVMAAVLLALACVPASAAPQDAASVREYSLPNGMTLKELLMHSVVGAIVARDMRAIALVWDRVEGKVADEPPGEASNPLIENLQKIASQKPRATTTAKAKAKRASPPKAKGAARSDSK